MMQNWISFMPMLSANGLQDRGKDHDIGRGFHDAARGDQDTDHQQDEHPRLVPSAPVTDVTKPCGTPMIASASASGAEKAMIGRITPLTLAELTSIAGKSAKVSVFRMKPMPMVTTTAVAPASVGVRRPEKMP
jgi:hypothetical protein